MKVETIYVLERKNLGNYEHIEMSATAKIEDGEPVLASMLALKALVNTALTSKVAEYHERANVQPLKTAEEIHAAQQPKVEEVKEVVKEGGEAKPKGKGSRASKPKETPVTTTTDIEKPESSLEAEVVTTKTKAVKLTKYSSDIPEHKSIFGSHLAKKYGDKWKTVAEPSDIKAFTASLNGQDFIDADGVIVQSFLDVVSGFFGN
jgi:hypothetical protein